MSAARKVSRRKQPSDLQRSCNLANELIDLIQRPRKGVTIRHAAVAAHMLLRQVWSAGGGCEGGLIAFVSNALDESPALYTGPVSRRVH